MALRHAGRVAWTSIRVCDGIIGRSDVGVGLSRTIDRTGCILLTRRRLNTCALVALKPIATELSNNRLALCVARVALLVDAIRGAPAAGWHGDRTTADPNQKRQKRYTAIK